MSNEIRPVSGLESIAVIWGIAAFAGFGAMALLYFLGDWTGLQAFFTGGAIGFAVGVVLTVLMGRQLPPPNQAVASGADLSTTAAQDPTAGLAPAARKVLVEPGSPHRDTIEPSAISDSFDVNSGSAGATAAQSAKIAGQEPGPVGADEAAQRAADAASATADGTGNQASDEADRVPPIGAAAAAEERAEARASASAETVKPIGAAVVEDETGTGAEAAEAAAASAEGAAAASAAAGNAASTTASGTLDEADRVPPIGAAAAAEERAEARAAASAETVKPIGSAVVADETAENTASSAADASASGGGVDVGNGAAASADRDAATGTKASGDSKGTSGSGGDADGGEGKMPELLSAPREGGADDLKQIKGVGPKLEGELNAKGVYHFDQIASWTDEEIAWADQNLVKFKGRVSRDNWRDQAKLLAEGGETEFSKKVSKGGVY